MSKAKLFILAVAVLTFSLAQAQVDTLTLMHVNDTHSHLLPYGPKDSDGNWTWGGMARMATLIGMTRMTEPNVMLFHSGDLFVGDFMFQEYVGVAELEIMKALGYTALELGNHEFDLYPSTLKYVLNQAGFPAQGFPVLCANLDMTADPELDYFVQPYIIQEISGVRVGVFGLMTELTNQISNPSPVVVLPPLAQAQAWVDTLRIGHDCDLVIPDRKVSRYHMKVIPINNSLVIQDLDSTNGVYVNGKQILKEEHRVIERVLDAVECEVSRGRIRREFFP